jgi:hypothetical protein
MFTNIHSSPLMSHRGFVPVEYPLRMPMPHAMYGQREAGPPVHYGGQDRRLLSDNHALRSPLLEEFRSDRVRAWELKVQGHFMHINNLTECPDVGPIWTHRGV